MANTNIQNLQNSASLAARMTEHNVYGKFTPILSLNVNISRENGEIESKQVVRKKKLYGFVGNCSCRYFLDKTVAKKKK